MTSAIVRGFRWVVGVVLAVLAVGSRVPLRWWIRWQVGYTRVVGLAWVAGGLVWLNYALPPEGVRVSPDEARTLLFYFLLWVVGLACFVHRLGKEDGAKLLVGVSMAFVAVAVRRSPSVQAEFSSLPPGSGLVVLTIGFVVVAVWLVVFHRLTWREGRRAAWILPGSDGPVS
jgi:hypothetical protein